MMFLMVGVGAFAGGFLRWLFARTIGGKKSTFISNTLACGVAGFVISLSLPALSTALLITGFCGALSTWSTLARELGTMVKERAWLHLLGYISSTIGAGLLALALFL